MSDLSEYIDGVPNISGRRRGLYFAPLSGASSARPKTQGFFFDFNAFLISPGHDANRRAAGGSPAGPSSAQRAAEAFIENWKTALVKIL